jgi:hypothetical protein
MKIIITVACLVLVLFGLTSPVIAKGPESVTITGPGIDSPLELMDNANFDLIARLMEQTGLWYGTGDLPRAVEEPQGELGPSYTLTWINAGPPGNSVKSRTMVQLLYMDAENGPFIHTPDQESLENWGGGVIGWFAAPSGLQDTLVDLGVPRSAGTRSKNSAIIERIFGRFGYFAVVGFAVIVVLVGVFGIQRLVRLASSRSPQS